ncbi:MAG TPA: hypothetical protein VF720_09965 [Candidatus Eisenbacteria bacterium]
MRSRSMKWLFPLALVAIISAGCSEDDILDPVDPEDLAPPLGLTSITGDGQVVLSWQASNYDEDRDGFYVFQANGAQTTNTPEDIPSAFGTSPVATLTTTQDAGEFTQTVTGLANGTTYSFLVVAFKNDGDDVSRPSNIIVDTPREESDGVLALTNGSGNRFLDVDTQTVQANDDTPNSADVLSQSFNAGAGDRHGMVGVNGARIQDLGYVSSWDEVDDVPTGTASYPATNYSVQVLVGHVYAVYTGDNHYAKVYVTSLNSGNFGYSVRVAYQPQAGNNELNPGGPVGGN